MNKNSKEVHVKSDLTLFTILEGLHDLGSAGVTELADHVDLNKGTVYKHLKTLQYSGWIVEKENKYRLGLKFFRFGWQSVSNIELCTHGKHKVVELANETGLPSGFMIREGTRAVRTIYINNTTYEVMPDTVVYPLHATASGKAILSVLSEEKVRAIAAETGLPKLTDDTITNVDTLLEELEEIRKQGYALNREETSQRWNGVAAPVKHPDEPEVGALYLGWPGRTVSDSNLNEILDPLLAATDEIYLQLEY